MPSTFCFVNGSLFTEVLPLCGCWTFLKATKSPGFRTCYSSLWTCAPGAGGPLHEVFCTGNVCTCTGFACLLIALISAVFLRGCGGPERRDVFWILALAMYCLLSFLYVTLYLEYIRWTIGCSHFVSTHFAEIRHDLSFNDHVLGVIGKKYTHPEGGTMTE